MENKWCFRLRRPLSVVMSFSWLIPKQQARKKLAMILMLFLAATIQAANTWHVDASRPDDIGDGRTWETAKKTIQAAIDDAEDDDTILVRDGIYEPIQTGNKAITIRSVNGAQKTIIDGRGVERCATLGDYGSERKTVLEGFTLQNGFAGEGSGACGGILRHCTLINNGAPDLVLGGYHFNFNCEQGGGAYDCTLSHCLVKNNQANYGGGACKSKLINCLLTGNQAREGGGTCDSMMINCTVTENHANYYGGGMVFSYEDGAESSAYNCIIWGNTALWAEVNYDENTQVEYSCTYPLPPEDEENIARAPKFVDPANGDFRLRADSPCLDAGNNEILEEFGEIETDLAGNPRISNDAVDMGAYEGAVDGCVISGRVMGKGVLSPLTAVIAQGGSATFTATATDGAFQHFEINGEIVSESPDYTWNNIQADGVITAVFSFGTWHVDAARPDDSGDGLTWTTALRSIQAAIDKAVAGDLILVKPGVYAPIVTNDKAITIRSVNGAETTIIDGGGRQRCATLSGMYFGRQTVLDGFTLQNGAAVTGGGGLFGGTALNCRITNCIAEGNDDMEREMGGGGASYAALINCTLSRNKAPYGGGAEHCTLDNCILTANQAYSSGGGAYESIVRNCTITNNEARAGGGVDDCAVYNSIVWNNQAKEGPNYTDSEWSDTTLYFSCSKPLPQGEGNINANPRFVDAMHGDFRLRAGSRCVDAGNNDLVTSATDQAGNPRIGNAKVDMGALEGKIEGWVISGRVQGNGTMTPLTAVVEPGGSVTFHATAGIGTFQHFLIDREIVSESPDYTWENIENNGIITAVFTSAIWYVDAAQPDDNGDGLSWDTAKKTIQAALDAANDGDLVLVKAGIYKPIDGYGKGITIRSVDGAKVTIIDGGGTQRCALAATLEGFTLQNGLANNGGGALACVLNQCILSGNTADLFGGGAYESTLNNCILTDNTAARGGGGGAASSTLTNCLLTRNTATWDAAGALECTLRNCTVTGNSTEWSAGGVSSCTLRNCIVWDNVGWPNNYHQGDSDFMYSCSDPKPAGEGNIGDDPEFVDVANGAYHLGLGSKCIDAGNNNLDYVLSDTDLAGGPRVRNGIVDMGAYERNTDTFIVLGQVQGRGKISPQIASLSFGDSITFTVEETSVGFLYFLVDGEIVSEEPTYTWDKQEDGVIIAVFEPAVLYVDADRPDDNGDGLSWETAKKNLQTTVASAHNGETILVKAGRYEPINTGGKPIIIIGVDGANATIIDGGGTQCCAILGEEWFEEGTLLEGFTLQNGLARNGGGVFGGRLNQCIISDNTANYYGGGAYHCQLYNCLLIGNHAQFGSGGGAYQCRLYNCTLFDNAATWTGGGIEQCEATNCIVWNNTAKQSANHYDSQLWYSCTAPLPDNDENFNISENPCFVDAANGDFRLRADSPCINTGDLNQESGDWDLAGNPRLDGPAIDMGAYEGSVAGFVISGRVQGNGALWPMTSVALPGSSLHFEAIETGSAFLHFLIDGEIVSQSPNYTWENVQADGVITAVFATATWYVDATRADDNGDGRTWETAKKTIQAAVDIAGKDDLILVNPGIYGPIDASTHPLVIRSVQGAEATVIDAVGKTSCAKLGKALGKTCTVLDGFTLSHGRWGQGGGAYAGILNNCTLTDNLAYHGGGAAYCTLNNCTLTKNSAGQGGGAYISTLTNCTVTENTADMNAGGADYCILNNCTLTDNTAVESGGGSYDSTLNNCLLAGNSARIGGGAWTSTLTNCTVTENSASLKTGGVHSCTLYNSIVWGNTAEEDENHADSTFYYSCTDPMTEGEGNISEDPMFINAAVGDYRLPANSPCFNTGNNAFVIGETDLAGNPRILAEHVDMGALETVGFIITGRIQGKGEMFPQGDFIHVLDPQEDIAFGIFVADGASVTFEAVEIDRGFSHFMVDDAVVSELPTYTWENIQADGVITAVFEPKTWYVDADQDGDGSSWESALASIQAAIEGAADDDTILVNDGTYGPIWTGNMAITIRSANGADKTIIDGGGEECCATLADDTPEYNTLLDGFTMQNGIAAQGGGAYGGNLTNCILRENTAEYGGGAHSCVLTNCTLDGNTAKYGGGAYGSFLTNCTVSANSASHGGGGVLFCFLYNGIVWGNLAPIDANYAASSFRYSCTDPLPNGEGNICEDPMFVDGEAGDVRLSVKSPCIDAGNNVFVISDVDLAGNPRILYGVVDMGAFEFTAMSALPGGKYDWQKGWNTLYLPFDNLDPDTVEALGEMPVFKLDGDAYVHDKPVSLHTPLWVFCADPESAPLLQGALSPTMPADPLDVPEDQWTLVGAQRRIAELPDGYAAWEWRDGKYAGVQSLQPDHVYFIYRSKTP